MVSNDIFEEKYLLRNGGVEDYRLFGAFPDEGEIEFCLSAHRSAGIGKAVLILHTDGLSGGGERFLEKKLEFKEIGLKDVLHVKIPVSELLALGCSLFYYSYKVELFEGGKCFGGEGVTKLEPVEDAGERQLLIYSGSFRTPEFLKGGNVYHIFVDRFYSSRRCAVKDGAILNPDWDNAVPMYPEYRGAPLKNNEFFGGDIWGIKEKLGYLEKFGITAIYLSPVFESPSNHKYDTSDYLKVDSMFGGDKALEALCSECSARGIEIILDGVFNHTGDDSVYFDRYKKYKNGACSSKSSPYYHWYNFTDYPEKYECWWGIDILPRVKSEEKSYRNFIFGKCGVVDKWMNAGVAGFRLDVADELCDGFLDEMNACVKAHRPDGVVIGEVWEDASNKISYGRRRHYFSGGQLDSVMNYPLREGIISFIKNGDCEKLRRICEGIYRRYPKCVSDALMNFLGTHDTERIITVLAGDSGEGRKTSELAEMRLTAKQREKGKELLKCSYTIAAFMYGFPSVFYGDETGVEGYHDPFCRRPYPWNNRDKSLEKFFAAAGKIRLKHSVLKDGLFEVVYSDEDCFTFKRYNNCETLFVCVTRSKEKRLCFSGKALCLLSSRERIFENKKARAFLIPPWTAAVFCAE